MLTQVVAAFSMDFSAAQRRRNKFSCYNYGNKEFPMATTETTFSVQIPSNLLKLGISQNEIQNRVSEWLVFSLFSEGKISSGKAGKLLLASPGWISFNYSRLVVLPLLIIQKTKLKKNLKQSKNLLQKPGNDRRLRHYAINRFGFHRKT